MTAWATDNPGASIIEVPNRSARRGIQFHPHPYVIMVHKPQDNEPTVPQLQNVVQRLEHTLTEMRIERDRLVRRRRLQILLGGLAISLVAHLLILLYLATIFRHSGGSGGSQPVSFEFAIVQDEQLTELEPTNLDDLLPEVTSEIEASTAESPEISLDPSLVGELNELSMKGMDSTLGGSGQSSSGESMLGGAGAGTSFFGVSSRGTRFAYIVDRSASMSRQRKMLVAMQELSRSVSSLPDYSHFYIVLFSSEIMEPPMQRGWTRARQNMVDRINNWLDMVTPGGGTEPTPAFLQVFALDVRPDVIFFLTDGEIPNATASDVAALNNRGKRVVINTIAFGDPSSQEQLRQIANDSGGAYRFVPSEGR